jgi:uncharacterized protein
VIGKYSGRNRISGKSMSAAAVHIYDLRDYPTDTLRDRKVFRFRMFADTKCIWDAMS